MPELPSGTVSPWVGLAVAIGCGLLVGIERERRKGQGPSRAAAGVRSFTIAALAGSLGQWIATTLSQPWIVLVGATVVGGLAVASHWRSRSDDPGLTTELSLFVTFLVGMAAMISPALAAAAGVLLAALLAARRGLQRFATEVLSERELHDALWLAALALVALPLSPHTPIAWLGDISLHTIVRLVVLILAVQGLGHVAVRLWGTRHGLLVSGFFAGFASSTATVATHGAHARRRPRDGLAAAAGAIASGAATWILALLVATTAAPALLPAVLPACAAGALMALLVAALLAWRGDHSATPGTPAPDRAEAHAFSLRTAVVIALLLAAVSAGVGWAQAVFGPAGYWLGLAIGATADAHAAIASAANQARMTQSSSAHLLLAVSLAVGINTGSRTIVAFLTGGPRYGAAVGAGLACSLLAALSMVFLAS